MPSMTGPTHNLCTGSGQAPCFRYKHTPVLRARHQQKSSYALCTPNLMLCSKSPQPRNCSCFLTPACTAAAANGSSNNLRACCHHNCCRPLHIEACLPAAPCWEIDSNLRQTATSGVCMQQTSHKYLSTCPACLASLIM